MIGLALLFAILATQTATLALFALFKAHDLYEIELAVGFAAVSIQFMCGAACSAQNFSSSSSDADKGKITIRACVTRLFILGVSTSSIWGGALTLWGAFVFFNQEYLHWIPTMASRQFSDTIQSRILEYSVIGIVPTAIGIFLSWYLFRKKPSTT